MFLFLFKVEKQDRQKSQSNVFKNTVTYAILYRKLTVFLVVTFLGFDELQRTGRRCFKIRASTEDGDIFFEKNS